MFKRRSFYSVLIGWAGVYLLVACSPAPLATPAPELVQTLAVAQVMTQVGDEANAVATQVAATLTAQPTATSTHTPSPTFTPTSTPPPTLTPTSTASPSPTLISTPRPVVTRPPAATPTPEIVLSANEQLAQGLHFYSLTRKCSSNENYNTTVNVNFNFINSNTFIMESNDRPMGNFLTYYRYGTDQWGTGVGLPNGGSMDYTVTFIENGLTMKLVVKSNGSIVSECTYTWLRIH